MSEIANKTTYVDMTDSGKLFKCTTLCLDAEPITDNGTLKLIKCKRDKQTRLPNQTCGHHCITAYATLDNDNKSYVNQIKDSGERTVFPSGAVRDMSENKGDMVSMPWEAILRLSRHYEAGAKKYNRWNYRKGINLSSYIDSACRHLAKYQCGCDDEDHLAAAAFNVLGAMLTEEIMPELIDLPTRQGKNRFCYFENNRDLSAETETVTVK